MALRELPKLKWKHDYNVAPGGYPSFRKVFNEKYDEFVELWSSHETMISKVYLEQHPEVQVLFSMLIKSFINKRPVSVRSHLEEFFAIKDLKQIINDKVKCDPLLQQKRKSTAKAAEDLSESSESTLSTPAEPAEPTQPAEPKKTREPTKSSKSFEPVKSDKLGKPDRFGAVDILPFTPAIKHHPKIAKVEDGEDEESSLGKPRPGIIGVMAHRQDSHGLSVTSMRINPEDPKEFLRYKRLSAKLRMLMGNAKVTFKLKDMSEQVLNNTFESVSSINVGSRQIGSHDLHGTNEEDNAETDNAETDHPDRDDQPNPEEE